MSQITVHFNDPREVSEFTNIVERYPYHMDMLRSSNASADAKSILGILALGIERDLKLMIYEEECVDVLKQIEKYTVKG